MVYRKNEWSTKSIGTEIRIGSRHMATKCIGYINDEPQNVSTTKLIGYKT